MTFRPPLVTRIPAPGARQDWLWNTPDTLLNPPGLVPFFETSWPNPRGALFASELRTWVQSIGALVLVAPPARQDSWPNPRGYPYPIELRTWVWSGPDTLFPPPGRDPNAQRDWPNPRGRVFPIELRTWINDLLQSTLAPVSTQAPFHQLDWPNPRWRVVVQDFFGFFPPPEPAPPPPGPPYHGKYSRAILRSKNYMETRREVFDFTSQLLLGEEIQAAWTENSVYSGSDSTPDDMLRGNPTHGAKVVYQRIQGGSPGVTYQLLTTVRTQLDNYYTIGSYLSITATLQ